MQQTAGHLFSSTSGGCQTGGRRKRKGKKSKRKRKRRRRKTQRGGRVLYGPTFTELESVSNIGGLNRGVVPHSTKNSTCTADGNMRGGGHNTLVGTPIADISDTKGGHGYGYVLGGDQKDFRGSRPDTKSYHKAEGTGCQTGGKRKRKRRRKRKSKRKTRRKSRRKSKRRRRRRRTKKVMKGGHKPMNYSFTGKLVPGLPKGLPLGKGSGITENTYDNCPENTYNHYTRKST